VVAVSGDGRFTGPAQAGPFRRRALPYQPIVDLHAKRATAAEALVRRQHPRRGLGMRFIAEGVETEARLVKLRAFGADGMQGYLSSRALAGPDFARFLATFAQPDLAGMTRALPHAEHHTA